MKKQHHKSLKIHTIYNLIIAVIFIAVIIIKSEIALIISALFLLFYIAGNSIIHANKNVLNRDILIEYLILSIIATIVLASAFLN